MHPLDSGETDDDWGGVSHGIYLGAAGMLWGLDRLALAGAVETSIDLLISRAARRQELTEAKNPRPSGPAASSGSN